MLSRHLSEELREELSGVHSAAGGTLEQLTASGRAHADSSIGVYVGDADAFRAFAPLLDPIIAEYHGATGPHPGRLRAADPRPRPPLPGEAVISTRIRVARSLAGFRLPSTMDEDERAEVEVRLRAAFDGLPDGLRGSYLPLGDLDPGRRVELVESHLLFRDPDRFLLTGGLGRGWPRHRGLFLSERGAVSAWVNEEDHLRLISLRPGGDLEAVFADLVALEAAVASVVDFAYDDRLGYLASCPSNLGTGMRASVLVRLPNLGADLPSLKTRAKRMALQVRGLHGETSEAGGAIFDVSNARRLGVTERELIDSLYEGVEELLRSDASS